MRGKVFRFLLVVLFGCMNCWAADVPEKFLGEWQITVIPQGGVPRWQWIKYPVKLRISRTGGTLVDQTGFECSLSKFLYDDELDVFVFNHCGIGPKSPQAFEIVQIAKLDSEGNLVGEVRNYRKLFGWKGVKLSSDSERRE